DNFELRWGLRLHEFTSKRLCGYGRGRWFPKASAKRCHSHNRRTDPPRLDDGGGECKGECYGCGRRASLANRIGKYQSVHRPSENCRTAIEWQDVCATGDVVTWRHPSTGHAIAQN